MSPLSRTPIAPTPLAGALRVALAGMAAAAVVLALLTPLRGADEAAAPAPPLRSVAAEPNPVTPGDFTGYGFDQCLAPTQQKMDAWLYHSPFLAVGIYISGNSRWCRDQPNLTPDWIRTQLRKGWRLLPITLGPQASCHPGFPRYDDDPRINPRPGEHGRYGGARKQGAAEAEKAVAEAKRLGIVPGSTLWYDLEGFDLGNTHCRESALAFLSAWTSRLHALDYVSGVYSSAGSGIKMLDDARVERPRKFDLPDAIWIARWDGVANTSTSYIRDDGWLPGGRVKQYQGGHNETWGGVTINIDRNYLDVGRGSVAPEESHCGGVAVDFRTYPRLAPPSGDTVPPVNKVKALQCLLTEKSLYSGKVHGRYDDPTIAAVKAWQAKRGLPVGSTWTRAAWVQLLSAGSDPALKIGSAGADVRRLQRSLNAAVRGLKSPVSGVFTSRTAGDVKRYQDRAGLAESGIANPRTWAELEGKG